MRDKEYSWFMMSNAPGFGAKSIHYIYGKLQANNLTINDLFEIDTSKLISFFPEIGKGKFSRASFSSLPGLEVDDKLYSKYEQLKSEGVTIIGLDDSRYPEAILQNMQDEAPPILYCKGYLTLLNQKGVSIVGARDVGEFEILVTKSIAQRLAENGLNVTSGYAKGVDTSAHIGALEAEGTTTMILSFGTNHISIKKELRDLGWEKNSLFITQFAPYEKFSGQNAMTRNKLVCAMSKAIVVIKSGPERDKDGRMSGTFDAGKAALKMGIPVFVLNPQLVGSNSQGNADLIRLGGIEFSDGMDIVRFLEGHSQEIIPVDMLQNQRILIKKSDNNNSRTSHQTKLPF